MGYGHQVRHPRCKLTWTDTPQRQLKPLATELDLDLCQAPAATDSLLWRTRQRGIVHRCAEGLRKVASHGHPHGWQHEVTSSTWLKALRACASYAMILLLCCLTVVRAEVDQRCMFMGLGFAQNLPPNIRTL